MGDYKGRGGGMKEGERERERGERGRYTVERVMEQT